MFLRFRGLRIGRYLKLTLYVGGALVGMYFARVYFLRLRADDERTFNIAFGAFLGAAFSFLFVQIAAWLNRTRDRTKRNYLRLVVLQRQLNEALAALVDNQQLAEGFRKATESQWSVDSIEPTRTPSFSVTVALMFPEELVTEISLDDLTNVDLVNDLFSFQVHLKNLNRLIRSVNLGYQDAAEEVRKPGVLRSDFDAFLEQRKATSRHLKVLRGLIDKTLNECIDVLAKVRVLSEDQPLFDWLLRKVTRSRYRKEMKPWSQQERSLIKSEMEEVRAESRERIRAVLREIRAAGDPDSKGERQS